MIKNWDKMNVKYTCKLLRFMDLELNMMGENCILKVASGMALSSLKLRLHRLLFIHNLKKPDWTYECGWCSSERPIPTTGLSSVWLLCFMEDL